MREPAFVDVPTLAAALDAAHLIGRLQAYMNVHAREGKAKIGAGT
jgi:hypothetical protein